MRIGFRGINANNIHELSGSGIKGVAVISAIFASENIRSAAIELKGRALNICV